MLDSVTETIYTRVLHVDVDRESRIGFANTKIRLPHGLGLAIILALAFGLCRVPASGQSSLPRS